jgi:hypothetical protein
MAQPSSEVGSPSVAFDFIEVLGDFGGSQVDQPVVFGDDRSSDARRSGCRACRC